MRISVVPHDAGHITYMSGRRFRVFLNGAGMADIITADDELGFVTLYKKDQRGALIIRPGGVLEEETRFGIVRIEEINTTPSTPEAIRVAVKKALREFH